MCKDNCTLKLAVLASKHPVDAIGPNQLVAHDLKPADVAYVKHGSTPNFDVSYDQSLGTDGQSLSAALLSSCEWEYAVLKGWFGGITPASLPFNVYIDLGANGASHADCLSTTIHCDAFTGTDADLVRMVLAAEIDEVFMAAQNKGWNCGANNGEGLSRVLAAELYPLQLGGFATAASWLDGGRPNWIDNTENTDKNSVSIGCAALFINFLHYELTYSWNAIIAAAAPTLAGVYKNLTGQTDAWVRFSTLMQAYFPAGKPSGLTNDNPFPVSRHGSSLVQGTYGNHGNFELIIRGAYNGLVHLWRNNDLPGFPWSNSNFFGPSTDSYLGAALIQSNFQTPGSVGNLEVTATTALGQLHAYWRDAGPEFIWSEPVQLTTGVTGKPALIQSKFGTKGNLEVVVPNATSGLTHMSRNNDDPKLPWTVPYTFASSLGKIDAVTFMQSNFGSPGNFEVIVRVGTKLYGLWRDSGPALKWSDPYPIMLNLPVTGQPCLIQSRFGTKGNFELVVPNANGGFIHLWRNNDDQALPWSNPTSFGTGSGIDCNLIQSNFGDPANLEVVIDEGGALVLYWRVPGGNWNGPAQSGKIANR